MAKRQYVCRECKRFTLEKKCPVDGSTNLSVSWKGLAVINDPNNSEIAQLLGITVPGKYALFVG